MKNKILSIGFLAIGILSSCTQNEVLDVAEKAGMTFSPFVGNATKTSVSNNINKEGSTFGVWGSKQYAGDSHVESVFTNQLVEYTDNAWVYAPLKFWDVQATYSFYAYSPFYKSQKDAAKGETAASHEAGITTISNFKVAPNVIDQEDLLISTPITNHQVYNADVTLSFNHVLTNVYFKIHKSANLTDLKVIDGKQVDQVEVKLDTVIVKGAKAAGTFVSNAEAKGTWTLAGEKVDFTAACTEKNPMTVTANAKDIENLSDMLMIPQQTPLTIDLEYTINGEKFVRKNLDLGTTPWTVNRRVTYTLTLDANKIEFNTEVNNWELPNIEEPETVL